MSNTKTNNHLSDSVNLGLPILLLFISASSILWVLYQVKNKKIEFKALLLWFILNIVYTVCVAYIFISTLLHFFNVNETPNIFNTITQKVFGINLSNGKEWVFLLIFTFISYILINTMKNSIKINKLEMKINELNKQTAILSGKVNRTTNFEELPLAVKKEIHDSLIPDLKSIQINKKKVKVESKSKKLMHDKTLNKNKEK